MIFKILRDKLTRWFTVILMIICSYVYIDAIKEDKYLEIDFNRVNKERIEILKESITLIQESSDAIQKGYDIELENEINKLSGELASDRITKRQYNKKLNILLDNHSKQEANERNLAMGRIIKLDIPYYRTPVELQNKKNRIKKIFWILCGIFVFSYIAKKSAEDMQNNK